MQSTSTYDSIFPFHVSEVSECEILLQSCLIQHEEHPQHHPCPSATSLT